MGLPFGLPPFGLPTFGLPPFGLPPTFGLPPSGLPPRPTFGLHQAARTSYGTGCCWTTATGSTRPTSPFDFRIDFRDTGIERLENVTSVELTSLTVPQVDTDPYVILDSFELGEHMLSSSSSAHQTYNVGIFRGDLQPGNVVTLRQTDMAFPSLKLFVPPLGQLERISLKLKKYNGNIVQSANTENNNTVIACFEITTDPSLRRQH